MKKINSLLIVSFAIISIALLSTCKKKDKEEDLTAPVLTTTVASSVSNNTALSGGNISSDGGASVTARGVCWSIAASPTVSGNKTTDGAGTGSFTSSITGLNTGTTYHVRAYATNSVGTTYGNEITFTTLGAGASVPVLTTTSASSVSYTTALSGGNISSDGGSAVTVRGICWSTSTAPTIAGNKTSDGSGTGSYTSSMTALNASTVYYVRAYATNSVGTAYGNQISFTTLGGTATLPVVTTAAINNITHAHSHGGGDVTSDGGVTVTEKGVCWSTTSAPTIANSKTNDGSGAGAFTSLMSGLSVSTVYYVRAYATNSVGTAYGNEVSFTTLTPTPGTVTDVDGNLYHTIVIGTQIWMDENLKVTHYRNGDPITNVTDNTAWGGLTTEAYCWQNNDYATNGTIYGALYNWFAVNDVRNLAPDGWHVATDADWTILDTYAGGLSVAGGKLKEAGLSHWTSPNTGATNDYGFTGLPGGYRYSTGTFAVLGYYENWWTSTVNNTNDSWYRYVSYTSAASTRAGLNKRAGCAVRCVKD